MNSVGLIAQDIEFDQFLTADDDPFQVVDQLVSREGRWLGRSERSDEFGEILDAPSNRWALFRPVTSIAVG